MSRKKFWVILALIYGALFAGGAAFVLPAAVPCVFSGVALVVLLMGGLCVVSAGKDG